MTMLPELALATALVTSVVDGDTVKVQYDDASTATVRLIGIDTPERLECYGAEATQALREYVLHKQVMLEADSTQSDLDRYGRQLRYIWLGGDLINLRLVANGFAREYKYKRAYKYRQQFLSAQRTAVSFGDGLWSECVK